MTTRTFVTTSLILMLAQAAGAQSGAARGWDFGVEIGRNLIHASDGPETAAYEIPLYFAETELVSWPRATDAWINE